jgi:hypothetical protein
MSEETVLNNPENSFHRTAGGRAAERVGGRGIDLMELATLLLQERKPSRDSYLVGPTLTGAPGFFLYSSN